MIETCECCGRSQTNVHVAWYLFDDNAEMTLCRKCVQALRVQGETVERIPVG
jgi:ribosome-binding protein aMBF1 (putative translation factor)